MIPAEHRRGIDIVIEINQFNVRCLSRFVVLLWFSSQMSSLLRKYNNFVLRSPLLAMSLTTGTDCWDDASSRRVCLGTTMGLGNIISQTIIEKRNLNNLDWTRITRFAAFGYLFTVQFVCTTHDLCSYLSGRDPFFAIGTMDWISISLVRRWSRWKWWLWIKWVDSMRDQAYWTFSYV